MQYHPTCLDEWVEYKHLEFDPYCGEAVFEHTRHSLTNSKLFNLTKVGESPSSRETSYESTTWAVIKYCGEYRIYFADVKYFPKIWDTILAWERSLYYLELSKLKENLNFEKLNIMKEFINSKLN